jgi:hypothetical protein
MADEIDRANEAAELFRENALKAHKPVVVPAGIGMCLNCGADLAHDGRFCDAECRDDFDKYVRGH